MWRKRSKPHPLSIDTRIGVAFDDGFKDGVETAIKAVCDLCSQGIPLVRRPIYNRPWAWHDFGDRKDPSVRYCYCNATPIMDAVKKKGWHEIAIEALFGDSPWAEGLRNLEKKS